MDFIWIFLCGLLGVIIARIIVKLTYVFVIKFIRNTYHWLREMLDKCIKQSGKK
jgi:hypothetical protein